MSGSKEVGIGAGEGNSISGTRDKLCIPNKAFGERKSFEEIAYLSETNFSACNDLMDAKIAFLYFMIKLMQLSPQHRRYRGSHLDGLFTFILSLASRPCERIFNRKDRFPSPAGSVLLLIYQYCSV